MGKLLLILYINLFTLFLSLALSRSVLAQSGSHTSRFDPKLEAEIEQINRLSDDFPEQAVKKIEALRKTIDRELDPANWFVVKTSELLILAETFDTNSMLKELALLETLASELPFSVHTVEFICAKASSLEYLGKIAEAELLFLSAVKLSEEHHNSHALVMSLSYLGWLYQHNGDHNRALPIFMRSRDLAKAEDNQNFYYASINGIAAVFTFGDEARQQSALELYEEAYEFYEKEGKRRSMVIMLINIAQIHLTQKNPVRSIEYLKKAIGPSKAIADLSLLGHIELKLARNYNQLRRFTEAKVAVESAIDSFTRLNNPLLIGNGWLLAAEISSDAGQPQKALEALQRYQSLVNSESGSENLLKTLELKAQAYHSLGDTKEELEVLRQAYPLLQKSQDEQEQRVTNRISAQFELERKESQNKVLIEQNKRQAVELEAAMQLKKILFAMFGLTIILVMALIFGAFKAREVRLQKRRIQAILDNIQEGILKFGKDLAIEPGYSEHLNTLLHGGANFAGQDFFQCVIQPSQLPQGEKSLVQQSLYAMMGEHEVAWELNASHLPHELSIEGSTLSLLWNPQFNPHRQLESMMLVLRDITDSKRLEARISLEQSRTDQLTSKIQEILSGNPQSIRRFILDLQTLAESSVGTFKETREELLRMHTLKGNARSLGLKSLAEAAHQFEEQAKALEPSDWDQARLAFQAVVDQYHHLIGKVLNIQTQTRQRTLFDIVADIAPDLKNHLERHHFRLDGILLQDRYMDWTEHQLQALHEVLLHGLTNAVDHGFIISARRHAAPKSAVFTIDIHKKDQIITLDILDNGAGIDWQALTALAQQKGFQPGPRETVAELVFLESVTTSTAVTQTSGRGIGLSAVKSAIHKLHGTVHLTDNPHMQGACLSISFPLHKHDEKVA